MIARGDVTMWVDESVLGTVPDGTLPRLGRPHIHSDATIQMLLGLKQVFHLPLRALQGFACCLRKLAFPKLPVPNFDRRKSLWDTTLSRRARELAVTLPAMYTGESMHLLVDSTGVKLHGEGEWKVCKHGYSKRRIWRKVHLAMDANTGQVCAAPMTPQDVADADALPDLLDQIPEDVPIGTVGGDGAYDTRQCHDQIEARNLRSVASNHMLHVVEQRHGQHLPYPPAFV
ncbi:hypothetical protein A9975_25090 [Cupriavidus sp. UME77]|nr:hypothetical protein [Cupriavidus sp. UME77]